MIAGTLWADNNGGRVIHRFHKRESCVFHSIHRFSVSFLTMWNNPLTCDNAGMERVFARVASGQLTLLGHGDGEPRCSLTRAETHAYTRRALRRNRGAPRRNSEAHLPA
jgi:hypothetical protein